MKRIHNSRRDFLRSAGLSRTGIDYKSAYSLSVVRDVKVLP